MAGPVYAPKFIQEIENILNEYMTEIANNNDIKPNVLEDLESDKEVEYANSLFKL